MHAQLKSIYPLEALSMIWAIPMTLAIQGGKNSHIGPQMKRWHAWLPQQINIAHKQQNPKIHLFGFLDAKLKILGV